MCGGPRWRMSSSSSPAAACANERRNHTMNLPNPFKLLWLQFRSEWRLYVRDRGAMFWTFAFPLLMLFGFGLIFRSGGPQALTLVRVAPVQESARDTAFVKALRDSKLNV